MRILKLIGSLIVFICLLSITAASQTIIPRMLLGRYQQVLWQDQQGLPANGIVGIAQTPDGYLWLGTSEGVARFDGVRFTTFDPFNTDGIKSGNIMSLLATRDGALWIGTHGGGVTRYEDGRFVNFSSNEGLSDAHARSLFEDSAGNVWVGTDGGGLNLFRDGRFLVFSTANGLPDDHIWAFAEDTAGNLWVGTNRGLARVSFAEALANRAASFPQPQITTYTTRDGLPDDRIRAVHVVDGDKIWVGMQNGLGRLENGRFLNVDAPDTLSNSHVHVINQTRDGSLWFGAYEGGLYRLKDGQYRVTTRR